jgi:hypothetical protein
MRRSGALSFHHLNRKELIMYSPKIYDDIVPFIYRVAGKEQITMTALVNRILKNEVLRMHKRLVGDDYTPHSSEVNRPKPKPFTPTKAKETIYKLDANVVNEVEARQARLCRERDIVDVQPAAGTPAQPSPQPVPESTVQPKPLRQAQDKARKRQLNILKGVQK